LFYLRLEAAKAKMSFAPASPPPVIHPTGHSDPPHIPEAVLASPFFPVWGDEAWLRSFWINPRRLKQHGQLRGAVSRLLEKMANECSTKPSTRAAVSCEAEVVCKDRVYALNPFDGTIKDSGPSPGAIDVCLFARDPDRDDFEIKFAILIVEIKPGDIEQGVIPATARDVDAQIRRRANAADDNEVVNQHLYLIGWIGCWFRPYYWDRSHQELSEVFEPNRTPGRMRPSK
jgi:hypothetical protein